jgi:hypothetical protein
MHKNKLFKKYKITNVERCETFRNEEPMKPPNSKNAIEDANEFHF